MLLAVSQKIEKDVHERLQWDSRVDGAEIEVSVSDGNVILSGIVKTYLAGKAAEMDAYIIPGVKKVINNLSVVYPRRTSDDKIAERIRSMVDWSADVDGSQIEVTVRSGAVFLQGVVKSYWEKMKTEEIASNTEGVTAIVNTVTVFPSGNYEDELITENIVHALDKNIFIDPHVVKVYVKAESGKVILNGKVPTWAAHEAIVHVVFCTPGVIDVVDNLTIGMKCDESSDMQKCKGIHFAINPERNIF